MVGHCFIPIRPKWLFRWFYHDSASFDIISKELSTLHESSKIVYFVKLLFHITNIICVNAVENIRLMTRKLLDQRLLLG